MKMKKLAILCCATLVAASGFSATAVDPVCAAEPTQIGTRSMVTTSVTLQKHSSKSVGYTISSSLAPAASSINLVISLQKYNSSTRGWETKSTAYESVKNEDSLFITGEFDTSNYGSGVYRIYVSGKDTTNGITTTWGKMISNTVNM